MNNRIAKVLAGWINLTEEEKIELKKEMENYSDADLSERRMIKEAYQKSYSVVLGPTGSSCPCCGR